MSDDKRIPDRDASTGRRETLRTPRAADGQPDLSSLFARKGEAAPIGAVPDEGRTRRRPTETAGRAPSSLTADLISVRRGPLSDADARNPVLSAPALTVGPPPNPRDAIPALPAGDLATALPSLGRNVVSAAHWPSVDTNGQMKRTTVRLDPERRRRLGLVAAFTGRTAQSIVTAALEEYLTEVLPRAMVLDVVPNDPAPKSKARRAKGRKAKRSRSQRSVRLHSYLHWRLKTTAKARGRSMQAIIIAALDSFLDHVGPAISDEVRDCLTGRVWRPKPSSVKTDDGAYGWSMPEFPSTGTGG